MLRSSRLFLFFLGVAACASFTPDGTTGQGQGAGAVNGASGGSFCERTCIPEDVSQCLEQAKIYREEFLEALLSCGQSVECIGDALQVAGPTEPQRAFSERFCERCAVPAGGDGCVDGFYAKGGAGAGLLEYTDAKFAEIVTKCDEGLAAISPGRLADSQCKNAVSQCVLDVKLAALNTNFVVCRYRPR